MGIPDLSELPAWAQAVSYFAFALAVGVTFALGRVGFLKGKNAPPEKASTSAQVAAVIVDSSSLDRLTAAAEAINVTLLEIVAAGKTSARATSAAARSSKDADRSIQQLGEAIDRLRDELIRAAAKME